MGMPATGMPVAVKLTDINRFGDDGLAREHWKWPTNWRGRSHSAQFQQGLQPSRSQGEFDEEGATDLMIEA